MTISNLYLSHQSYDWTKFANVKQHLKRLDKRNADKAIESANDNDYYTSIEDLTLDYVEKVFLAANKIHLVDLNFKTLSTINNLYSYAYWVSLLHTNAKFKIKTSNANLDVTILENINSLFNKRATDSSVVWVVGCSITAGMGVLDEQRYGYHVAKELQLPEVLLAKPGASIFWAADQILRSDVKKGDKVIWGITSTSRIDIAKQFDLISLPITEYIKLNKREQYWNIEYFDSPTQVITNLRYILQVSNYCEKVGAELYLINLLDPTWTDLAFSKKINYINLTRTFDHVTNKFNYLDLGTDNDHPGPLQHKEYAQQILNFIKEK